METTFILVAAMCAITCLVLGVDLVRLRSARRTRPASKSRPDDVDRGEQCHERVATRLTRRSRARHRRRCFRGALLWIIVCGGIAFGGLYELGTVLVDTRDCDDAAVLRLQISAALPLVRDEALTRLGRCR